MTLLIRTPRLIRAIGAIAALTLAAGIPAIAANAEPAAPGVSKHCPQLRVDLPWYGENRAKLQKMINTYGSCQRRHGKPKMAIFDWDNTVVKNDVGDAITFWMIRNGKVLQPPQQNWAVTSKYLTPAAVTALSTACGKTVPAGQPLPTQTDTVCADEIYSVYYDSKTTTGAKAYAGYNARRYEPAYAWGVMLLSGYTDKQVRRFAAASRAEALAAPIDSTFPLGSKKSTAWVRYYPQIQNLIRTLKKAKFDVWISSASPEAVVQVWAAGVNVKPDHVIGVKTVTTKKGLRLYHTEGCGGSGVDNVLNYIEGKRCFINKYIHGVSGKKAWNQAPAKVRQVFGAGDSNTDMVFVSDATKLRLIINRQKAELMCNAYFNSDGKWLVNPMFIQPKGAKSGTYPCSTTAYVNPDGSGGPVLAPNGTVIPDQADTVHG